MESITLPSHAKINLGLKVGQLRPDGYHDIRSFFQEVNLVDTVRLERLDADVIEIVCESDDVPHDERNLAARAARLLKDEHDRSEGVRISIQKRIPVGAGMGGGSSNGATTLVGLNRLWNLHLSRAELHALSLKLGSDVPFFLAGGAAVVSGRGEHLYPVRGLAETRFVAVDPGFRVRTAWAFENLEIGLTATPPYISFLNSVMASGRVNLKRLFCSLENDFLPLVSAKNTVVHEVLDLLGRAGSQCSSMTGSGSVIFGCIANVEAVESAAELLQSSGYHFWICQPRTI